MHAGLLNAGAISSGDLLPPSPPAEKATDSYEDSPSIIGGAGPLRLRTFHRAENIASALKRGVNVCQRQFVNEVIGPLVTEFIRNFGGEDATPIQHAFPTAAFSITSRPVKLVRHRGCLAQINQLPGRRAVNSRMKFFGRAALVN
jgi:hypothetical protein